jgi:hypothetical protein
MAKKKNPAAVALGRLGGLKGGKKGGKARAAALSPEERAESARKAAIARVRKQTAKERSDIARKAAAARWAGHEAKRRGSRVRPSRNKTHAQSKANQNAQFDGNSTQRVSPEGATSENEAPNEFLKAKEAAQRHKNHRSNPSLTLWSEYVPKDVENSEMVYRTRLQLIEVTREVLPEFLEELSSRVFPLYKELAKSGYNFKEVLWREDRGIDSAYDLLTEDAGLKRALSEWASTFHASRAWVLNGALRTLNDWCLNPDSRKALKWNSFGTLQAPKIESASDEFEFCYEAWDFLTVLWSDYSRALREDFERALLEYERRTRTVAEFQGLMPVPRKYSCNNLKWFVLHQFAGLSPKEIADRHDGEPDESTILKGIKAAAKLVAWVQLREPVRSRKIH